MSEGVSKNSRYEIIAILRDELRIQSKLYFYCNDIKHQSTLKKIEGNFFYIKPSTSHPGLPKESIFYFIIHSPLGKIEFTTNNRITDKSNSNNLLCFIIPESLSILQRRTSPRINVREGANKQVISSQADSLIKISRIWADFFPANTSNQPI